MGGAVTRPRAFSCHGSNWRASDVRPCGRWVETGCPRRQGLNDLFRHPIRRRKQTEVAELRIRFLLDLEYCFRVPIRARVTIPLGIISDSHNFESELPLSSASTRSKTLQNDRSSHAILGTIRRNVEHQSESNLKGQKNAFRASCRDCSGMSISSLSSASEPSNARVWGLFVD